MLMDQFDTNIDLKKYIWVSDIFYSPVVLPCIYKVASGTEAIELHILL